MDLTFKYGNLVNLTSQLVQPHKFTSSVKKMSVIKDCGLDKVHKRRENLKDAACNHFIHWPEMSNSLNCSNHMEIKCWKTKVCYRTTNSYNIKCLQPSIVWQFYGCIVQPTIHTSDCALHMPKHTCPPFPLGSQTGVILDWRWN